MRRPKAPRKDPSDRSSAPWHFDPTTTPGAGPSEFLTTALHEIAHVLGVGAPSWDTRITASGGSLLFHGAATTAAYGDPVPLDPNGGHFADGVASFVNGVAQETLLDPTTAGVALGISLIALRRRR